MAVSRRRQLLVARPVRRRRIGSLDVFCTIDADGDGVITVEEAIRADRP